MFDMQRDEYAMLAKEPRPVRWAKMTIELDAEMRCKRNASLTTRRHDIRHSVSVQLAVNR